jgi:hypothetical protein
MKRRILAYGLFISLVVVLAPVRISLAQTTTSDTSCYGCADANYYPYAVPYQGYQNPNTYNSYPHYYPYGSRYASSYYYYNGYPPYSYSYSPMQYSQQYQQNTTTNYYARRIKDVDNYYYYGPPSTPAAPPPLSPENRRPMGSLGINRYSGPPGMELIISGSAFPPNAPIVVYLGAAPVGTIYSNERGKLYAAVTVPNMAPGLYTVTATGANSTNPPKFRVTIP